MYNYLAEWKNQITETDEEDEIREHLQTVATDAMIQLRKEIVIASYQKPENEYTFQS